LRLLYVAFTRARDRLILTGIASRKTAAEKWSGGATDKIPTQRILEANSYLDRLGAWLPGATGQSDWTRSGQNSLLAWTIYQDGDARLAGQPESAEKPPESTELAEATDSAAWESLRQKLEWHSPFAAAVKFYEPQLKRYALALGRIYCRPVTESWLHFLSLKKSVAVVAAG